MHLRFIKLIKKNSLKWLRGGEIQADGKPAFSICTLCAYRGITHLIIVES